MISFLNELNSNFLLIKYKKKLQYKLQLLTKNITLQLTLSLNNLFDINIIWQSPNILQFDCG